MARTSSSNFVRRMEDGVFFYENEIPVGTINSSNKTFTLAATPNPTTSLKLYINGAEQKVTTDYTISGDTITTIIAPPTESIIECDYRVEPS